MHGVIVARYSWFRVGLVGVVITGIMLIMNLGAKYMKLSSAQYLGAVRCSFPARYYYWI